MRQAYNPHSAVILQLFIGLKPTLSLFFPPSLLEVVSKTVFCTSLFPHRLCSLLNVEGLHPMPFHSSSITFCSEKITFSFLSPPKICFSKWVLTSPFTFPAPFGPLCQLLDSTGVRWFQLQSMRVTNHTLPSNPIQRTTLSLDLASKMFFLCFSNKKHSFVSLCHFSVGPNIKVLSAALYSPALQLLTPWLDSFLPWSCIQSLKNVVHSFSSSFAPAEEFIFHNLLHQSWVFFFCCFCSVDYQPYETDCGKTLFQPCECFLPHSISL